jgi:zinc protease
MLDPLSVGVPIEKVVMPNGLTVLLDADHRVPLVGVRVVYRVGWAADPPERSGLAHLVEHLLFHGSRRVADGMHFRLLHDAGADFVNGTTAVDRTDLWELVPSSELALALWLESDRMSTGLENVTEARLDKELRIIERERAERVENVPNGRVDEFVRDSLFPSGHPLRATRVAGPGLDRATLDEVHDFHRRYYSPSNALLILAGDFAPEDAKALVRSYFGSIASHPTDRIPDPPPASATAASIQLEARVDAPSLVISWLTAPAFSPGDAELDVVASYLNQVGLRRFVRDTAIVSGAFAKQQSEAHGSTFRIGADLRPGGDLTAALAGIDAVVDRMRRQGIDDGDVRQFAYGWLFELQVDRDDLLSRSWIAAQSQLFFGNSNFMGRATERYRGVSAATVRAAIERYLGNERRVVAFITPNREAPIAGRLVANR